MEVIVIYNRRGLVDEDPARRFSWMKVAVAWSDKTGEGIRGRLRDAAPVRTGRLRTSIRYSRRVELDKVRMEYTAHTPYVKYVIQGTRPHIIRPRAARALHWIDAVGSNFATVVHHPGTRPNDFPHRVLEESKSEITRNFKSAIEEM